jgi:hypothetical protein
MCTSDTWRSTPIDSATSNHPIVARTWRRRVASLVETTRQESRIVVAGQTAIGRAREHVGSVLRRRGRPAILVQTGCHDVPE